MPMRPTLLLSLAFVLSGCATSDSQRDAQAPAHSAQREPDERDAADADPLLARAGVDYRRVDEAFVTAATPQD
ncbi:hypothetical protein AB4084_04655, partial [Lysobacter sp. 2RAB21]